MTALLVVVKVVLGTVIAVILALAVLLSVVAPRFGSAGQFLVMAAATSTAALLLAALPGKPRRRNGERDG